KNASAPVIAGVGRLHPQKNFALFLDVASDLARRNADMHFVIAGTGPEESALKTRAAALGIADRVRFAGYVADPREIYAEADVLLITSRYEGTPLTVLEAMASGVPVVASKLDGLEEIFTDGEDCALVAADDRENFGARVAELLDQPALARRRAEVALA